jgi:hypothetical protein
MQEPSPYFQQYADWLKRRAGRFTAGPPQLLQQYGIQLEDWRIKPIATIYGLAEVTGIPTLVRWGQAIMQNRPIAEVEREYFRRIAKGLQEAGIGVSEEALRGRVEQAAMHAAVTALPLAVPLSRAEAVTLAKALGAGFGGVGAPTAFIRAAQGYGDEALKAFIEAGLAGTVITDVALALKSLAPNITPDKLAAIRTKVAQQRRPAGEADAFVKEIEEALLALKRGDASRYDVLVKKLEEWQQKMAEFQELYRLKQEGRLQPEQERRYYDLLAEVSKIRDRYELLKQYVEAARELGLEAGARRAEFESRTIEDLARAAQEVPPGPPPRDFTEWLQRVDLGVLQKLVRDPQMLARYARRFGVDEQTLAERASLILRERQWERLGELPSDELKKMLMDVELLKRRASELGVAEDRLRAFIEDALQRRMGVKTPEPPPERPPIEPVKPAEHQFRPPEVEVGAGRGQVLLLKAEEELKPSVRRLEELPGVEERLKALLRGRAKPELQRLRERLRERARDDADAVGTPGEAGTTGTADRAPGKTGTDDGAVLKTDDKVTAGGTTVVKQERVVEREVLVLDRDALRTFVPALPVSVFAMPAAVVLPMISRAVGMPVALAPGLPKPRPRETFGAWLDRVFAGTGFTWRSLAAQKETFVFA